MKLIIDIDEEDFNLIRDNIKSYSLADKLFGAVKDGIPYEERPRGDTISREALKAEVALMFGDKTHITESVCELIDNAPSDEIKSTKDLINNIAGFDVSGIKPLPEYKDGITDVEQKEVKKDAD